MSFTNPYPASRLTVDTANSLSSGLVGFWPLTDGSGGTAKDITSNANDSTGSNISWASDDVGMTASLNGSSSYFTTGSVYTQSAPVTITCWIATTDVTWYAFDGVVSSNRMALFQSGSTMSIYGGGIVNATTTINDGNWHFVVAVFDGANSKIYIDGSLDVTGNAGSHSLTGLVFGTRYSLSDYLGGNLQNVRVYNRALSATEVATLYNRPWEGTNYGDLWPYSPPAPADATLSTDTAATSLMSGCVGWWLLTDGSGSTAVDIVGTNDGTLGSGVTWEDGATGKTAVFDGTANAKISLSSQPVGGQNISISAWINVSSSVSGRRAVYCDGSSFTQNYLSYDGTNKLFTFDHYQPSGEPNKTNTDYGIDDRWINVVVTQDATTTKIYYDGQLKFTGTAEVYGSSVPTVFNIGSRGGSESMDGNIQNVRIWDRALSADEITLLYERPFEGITYGDAFHYDPPTPANLTPLTSDSINNSQVGWWPLTETDDYVSGAADISGNGNNGTQSGGVLSDVSRLGGVASFDGFDDYIDIVGPPANTITQPLTLSAWVYNDPAGSGTNDLVALGKTTSIDPLGILRFTYTTGEFSAVFRGQSVASIISNAPNNPTGTWHHVCVLASSSTSLELFIDGVSVASNTSTNYGTLSYDNLTIGALQRPTVSNYSDGNVANVRVWSRALSAAEVWSIYSNPWLGSAYTATPSAVLYNYILRSKRFRRLS